MRKRKQPVERRPTVARKLATPNARHVLPKAVAQAAAFIKDLEERTPRSDKSTSFNLAAGHAINEMLMEHAFGARLVEQLAAATGWAPSRLWAHRHVVRTLTPAERDELASLGWSHLRLLADVADPLLRRVLGRRAVKAQLTILQLRPLVKEANARAQAAKAARNSKAAPSSKKKSAPARPTPRGPHPKKPRQHTR